MRFISVSLLGVALLLPATAAALPVVDAVTPLAPEGKAPARVVVEATDSAGRPVTSVRVDTAGGSFAESACSVRRSGEVVRPGGRFEVPVAGEGAAVVTVGNGACAPGAPAPETTSAGFEFRLPSLGETPSPLPLLPDLPQAPIAGAAAACTNADVQIRGRTRKLVRKAILCLVNVQRRAAGVRTVRTHVRLQKAAAAHATDMRRRSYFAHEGPDGPDLVSRLRRARYWPATAGENLAAGTGTLATARAIVDAWLHSAGHRANLLDKRFTHLGIGIEPMFPAPPSSPGGTVAAEFGAR